MSRTSPPPDRFDFAVITVNGEEFNAVQSVLGLRRRHPAYDPRGFIYYWGALKNSARQNVFVIHGTTGDEKNRNAEDLARQMIDLFDPDFILVLGTAGGFKMKGCKLGQVVYSRLVRSSNNRGHLEGIELEEAGNLPPDERLINLATDVAHTDKWRKILRQKNIACPAIETPASPEEEPHSYSPLKAEVFSGPDRIDNINASIAEAILKFYPRVSAVEMEAGEVARAILPFMWKGKVLGYLMIKGITDLPDDSDIPLEERKRRRREWAPYASAASAAFARNLICNWRRDERPSYSRFTSVPLRYQEVLNSINGLLWNSRALVLHRLHPTAYSELSKVYSELVDINRIFTVSAFEPNYFINTITEISAKPLNDLSNEEFLKVADGEFEHFAAFRNLAERGIKVTRIMLAHDSFAEWAQRNKTSLDLFNQLNGKVDCYVSEVSQLRRYNLSHMTDHVIYNSNLWLDYYDDSQTLIMTYEPVGPIQKQFTEFQKHFDRRSGGTNVYKPLRDFTLPLYNSTKNQVTTTA
jgi:nucleoside phosphorylase